MFSYRHAFHAGNHADVLKHVVVLALLRYMQRKTAGCLFVDTHAGGGCYDLTTSQARRNDEAAGGIAALWRARQASLPPILADYLGVVRGCNPGGELRACPGSPWLFASLRRRQDRLRLYELHPGEIEILRARLGRSAGVTIEHGDGFAGLRAVLPPAERRALVLIDPPYEDRKDYARVSVALGDILVRFPAAVCAIWYPHVQRPEVAQLCAALGRRLAGRSWLHVQLDVRAPAPDGLGLHGSGLFVLNPPWTLPAEIELALPVLAARLGIAPGAHWQLAHQIP